ncbi:MAG: hypothetical protein H7Y41_04860 [Hyphomonadaceae bacterium]|nr:hypothetical protein [Clostridia bacterium]
MKQRLKKKVQKQPEVVQKKENMRYLMLASFLIVGLYIFLSVMLKTPLFSTNSWDSYTMQAQRWLSGHIALDKDYPYLELAQYMGRFYTSFPVTPTIPVFLLLPFANGFVPSNLVVKVYVVASFFVTYFLCRKRFALTDMQSVFWAAFTVFGSNLVFMSMNGGVWFQSQTLNFLCTIVGVYYILGKRARDIHIGLIAFALAIGCRTTQILFAPFFAYFLIMFIINDKDKGKKTWQDSILRNAYLVVIPVLIMMGYALYNYVRFDSFSEIGYHYRPEFMRVNGIMFSAEYFAKNLGNILRLPSIDFTTMRVDIPVSEGFAFYLANPLIVVYLWRLAVTFLKKQKLEIGDMVGFACVLIYVFTILIFKGLGGWQFGQRYFVDFLPFALVFILKKPKIHVADVVLATFAISFNIYGTLYMFLEWNKPI